MIQSEFGGQVKFQANSDRRPQFKTDFTLKLLSIFHILAILQKESKTATEGLGQERNQIKEIGNSIRMNFIGVCCVREFFRWWTRKNLFFFFCSSFIVFYSVIWNHLHDLMNRHNENEWERKCVIWNSMPESWFISPDFLHSREHYGTFGSSKTAYNFSMPSTSN